jgi:lipopolysaccharide/colanic/teichoic acid biosynthesis glycosyltransferase
MSIRVKRLFDILVSAAALLLLSPLLLLIGAAVVLDSGFPVFFAQQRVGRNFRQFRLWKFRSMRASASGPSVTVAGDARITRLGRLLRNSKLDEIPQFWNVLCGQMSLVGPRPEVPEYVEAYRERYQSILSMRPGITDLASICFRNEEAILAQSQNPMRDYRDRILPIKLDLADKYVQSQSILGDISILVQTAVAIFCSNGSPEANTSCQQASSAHNQNRPLQTQPSAHAVIKREK